MESSKATTNKVTETPIDSKEQKDRELMPPPLLPLRLMSDEEQFLYAEHVEVDVELPIGETAAPPILAGIRVIEHGPLRRPGDEHGIVGAGHIKIGQTLDDWFEGEFPNIKRIDVQFHLAKPIIEDSVISGLRHAIAALMPMINRCEFHLDFGESPEAISIQTEVSGWQSGQTYATMKNLFISEGNAKWREAGWPGTGEAKVKRDDCNLWGWGRQAEIISWL